MRPSFRAGVLKRSLITPQRDYMAALFLASGVTILVQQLGCEVGVVVVGVLCANYYNVTLGILHTGTPM